MATLSKIILYNENYIPLAIAKCSSICHHQIVYIEFLLIFRTKMNKVFLSTKTLSYF
jgi:hypothetical protein